MAGFPSHPDEVTGDWLAERLRQAGLLGDGRITAVRWEAIGTGQVGDSVRFHLEYDAPDKGPATLAGKFPAADPTSRGTAAMLGLYAKEVRFYREVAAQLEVRVPATYAAEVSEDGSSFILLFEDLAPQRGGNQLAGCSIEDARHGIVQAAGIHAPSWRNPAILELDWLLPDPAATSQVRTLYPGAQALFRERYADTLEPEFMEICERLAASGTWMARSHPHVSLVHGDFRLDNMLFGIGNGAEPIAVLDWQTLSIGHPLTDIGYFLGCGIGDTLRRAHEAELLDLYCDEMTRRGVPLTRDEIWRDYVIGALHGVSTAVFSAAFVERTPRGDANFLSMARGACALALEHGSLQLLEEE
ncbi:MAG TPA: phosphotransferase [Erythrobacter sp.]|nr:phosphotransferase [Erythrobacter sp.]